jgi:hypothetical protein
VPTRGLTLVEVLITMTIFIALAGFTIMAVRQVVAGWQQGERRRVIYEHASGCIDIMADDLKLAITEEPPGVTEIKAKFIGDFDAATRQQRLMFVRTFETGPERALTFYAGDGQSNDMLLQPVTGTPAPGAAAQPRGSDGDDFTGLKVGDFKPLGGSAMIGYFVKNQKLYRAIHAPIPLIMSTLLDENNAQVLATDVLYLGFDYWSQFTQTWDEPTDPRQKGNGPEKIWDSTRAISVAPLSNFRLHRGDDSAMDRDDDVFPEKVRITLTVDSPMPRCIYAKLLDDLGESNVGSIYVSDTHGFPDGGNDDSCILLDDEWVHYRKKTSDSFILDKRGIRGTLPRGHKKETLIRTGKTFRRVVYLPCWREDLTPDEVWRARNEAKRIKARTIVR